MIKDINIIVPLKNENQQVKITVKSLIDELKNFEKKFIITFVDDYSNDNTWEELEKIKEQNDNVEIYKNKFSPGFGNALRFGIQENKCDAAVFFMGDCSDNPKDIINYVNYLDQGFDCVFGSRFIKNSSVKDYPLIKLAFNRIANNFIRLLFLIKYVFVI